MKRICRECGHPTNSDNIIELKEVDLFFLKSKDQSEFYATTEPNKMVDVCEDCYNKIIKSKPKKCLVKGCKNRSDQGTFVGDLCYPCYEMLTTGRISYGKTFIHELFKKRNGLFINEAIEKAEDAIFNLRKAREIDQENLNRVYKKEV